MHTSPPGSPGGRRVTQPLHGYRQGCRQPAAFVAFAWTCPSRLLEQPAASLAHLDGWLSGALAIDPQIEPAWMFSADAATPAPIHSGAWRILQLAAELLRLINIPVFEPGALHRISPDPQEANRWQIQALTPLHDHQPLGIYLRTYDWAARLISRLLETERTAEQLAAIQAHIEADHIERLSPLVRAALSTVPLLQRAYQGGIPFRHLGDGIYQLGWGCQARRVVGGANDLDSAIGSRLCQNKRLTSELLRMAGLPIPAQCPADTPEQALAAAAELGWPVVVKPADCDRGEGVSIDIATPEALEAAWRKARQCSSRILVEKQVPGTCHRLHVMAGQVISVSRRLPKAVRGDGVHTVRELIAIANRQQADLPPWRRLKPFPSDALAVSCLQRDGLALDAVPAAGQWACLRPFNAIEWGGELENCTDTVHPHNVEAATLAARVCGLSNAGIDMISLDISKPWDRNGAVINEVNFGPQTRPAMGYEFMLDRLVEHYFPAAGRIPIQVYLGGAKALEAARREQRRLGQEGVACSLVAFDQTLDPSGEPRISAAQGLFARCLAVLSDPRSEAMVVALQTGEWLLTGLPFDRPDRVIDCGDPLLNAGDLPQALVRARLKALLAQQPAGSPG